MTGNADATPGFDPFLHKESLAALARIGLGKRETRLCPHRFHGVGARTRLSVAGKRSILTTSTYRRQHHKERATISKINDLTDIAREIDSFTKMGMRIPVAVWEKYDRVNKRHKKYEDMLALATEELSKTNRKRRARLKQDQSKKIHDRPNQKNGTYSFSPNDHGHQHVEIVSSGENWNGESTPSGSSRNRRERRTASTPFQGGRCTFGTGRGNDEFDALETLARRATYAQVARSGGSRSSSWGPRERDNLNEIYWDLGRPPRRGAEAEREHFFRYTQRHCMVFPNRSPAEVIQRLKLMFRCNGMKEPNEHEYWCKLNAKRGLFPPQYASTTNGTNGHIGRSSAPPAVKTIQEPLDSSTAAHQPRKSAEVSSRYQEPQEPPPAPLESEALFRRSGGGGNGLTPADGRLSPATASYAAEAIKASSLQSSSSLQPRASLRGGGAVSPFYDPIRPNSPAWGFGEASPISSSRHHSRGISRGGGSSRGGTAGSRGGGGNRDVQWRAAGSLDDDDNYDGNGPEDPELLDYTSMGKQALSDKATSSAFTFARDGLGSENLSMFQADKRPEPGPGSFRPNLSATSTHPAVRCGVVMRGRPGSRGSSSGGGARGGGTPGGGATASTTPGPGPGQYSAWDAMGRQILSTRPSSPTVTFATGEWELR